jgi:hypothetical protein
MYKRLSKTDFSSRLNLIVKFLLRHKTLFVILGVIILIFYILLHRASALNLSADFAVGQPDTASSTANAGGAGVNPYGYNYQWGLASDGTHVFVGDNGNNRVLIYNTVPSASSASADLVLGQPDMYSNLANQSLNGFALDSTTELKTNIMEYWDFNEPTGSSFFNSVTNTPSADGTATGTTIVSGKLGNARTYNGVADQGLSTYFNVPTGASPRSVFVWVRPTNSGATGTVIGSGVAVAGRNAILGLVGGNVDFSSFGSNVTGSTSLTAGNWYHIGYTYDGTNIRIYVNGVLDAGPTPLVLNTSGTSTGFGFNRAQSNNFFDGTIDEAGVWSSALSAGAISDLYSSGNADAYSAGIGATTLNGPSYIATDGQRLFVADTNNSRVLIYNQIPTSDNAPADVVIGQSSMSTNRPNQGGAAAANTLNYPMGVSYDPYSGRFIISDSGNNRVLIYSAVPKTNNAYADVVVGQNDFDQILANRGGAVAANTLDCASSARIMENKLVVADTCNQRVLIFNSIPSHNDISADVVIGQTDLISNLENQGLTPDANTLSYPYDILWDGTNLLVQDDGNNRVLRFTGIPTTNNASADDAVGQGLITSNTAGSGANELNDPEGQLAQAGTTLLVGDSSNNRVLGYNNFLSTPTAFTTNPTQVANTTLPHVANLSHARIDQILDSVKIGNILYVGGIFDSACKSDNTGCVTRTSLAAIDLTTGLITPWNPVLDNNGTQAEVDTLLYSPTKNILYVGGFFDTVDSNPRGNFAAFDATTGTLLSWAPIADDGILTLEEYNSKLYAGGYFTNIDGNVRSSLASFDNSSDSGSLTSWAPPSDGAGVTEIKVNNGKIYVGGYFLTMGCLTSVGCPGTGENRQLLATFDEATGFLTSFNPIFTLSGSGSNRIDAMAFCGTNFFFGGNFDAVDSSPSANLAAIDLTTGLVLPWSPSAELLPTSTGNIADINTLEIDHNTLFVGGNFTGIMGESRESLASFDLANNNALSSWDPSAGERHNVFGSKALFSLVPTTDSLFASGFFNILGGTTSAVNIAKFNYTPSTATDVCAIPTPTSAPGVATNTPTQGPVAAPVCSAAKPGNPSNVTIASGSTSGQLVVSWTAAPAPVTDYSITYSDNSTTQKYGVVSTGNVTSYIISGLNPSTTYYFWVNAVNDCKPGDQIGPANLGGGSVSTISTPSGTVVSNIANTNVSPLPPTGPGDVVKIGVIGGIIMLLGVVLIFAL